MMAALFDTAHDVADFLARGLVVSGLIRLGSLLLLVGWMALDERMERRRRRR